MSAQRLRALAPLPYALAALALALAGTLAGYETQPYLPLGVLAATGALALALARPLLAVHLAIALIPLELVSVRFGAAFSLSPAEAMFALTGFGWAFRCLATRRRLVERAPLNRPFALTLVSILAGLAVSSDNGAVLKAAVVWTAFALVYCMLTCEGSSRTVRSLLMVLVLAGAAIGAIALFHSGGQAPQLVGQGATATGRATGSFNQPNILATFLAFALPAALVLAFVAPAVWRPWMAAGFGLTLAGLALSLSRGGFLAFTGAFLVLLGAAQVRRTVVLTTLVLVTLTALGANPLVGSKQLRIVDQRIESVRYTSAGTGDDRTQVWSATPAIIADHPLLGVGTFNFPQVAPRYGIVDSRGQPYLHAHDLALTITAERGLLGLLALLWGTVALVVMLARTIARTRATERALTLALAAGFCGLGLQGLVDYTLVNNAIVAMIFTLAGATTVMWREARR